RPAVYAHLTFAGETDTVAGINAGRNLNRQGFLFPDSALPLTRLAGVLDNLAIPTACRTGLLHSKETLLHTYLPHTLTGSAGFRTGTFSSTTAITGLTLPMTGNGNFYCFTLNRFFKIQIQGIP